MLALFTIQAACQGLPYRPSQPLPRLPLPPCSQPELFDRPRVRVAGRCSGACCNSGPALLGASGSTGSGSVTAGTAVPSNALTRAAHSLSGQRSTPAAAAAARANTLQSRGSFRCRTFSHFQTENPRSSVRRSSSAVSPRK